MPQPESPAPTPVLTPPPPGPAPPPNAAAPSVGAPAPNPHYPYGAPYGYPQPYYGPAPMMNFAELPNEIPYTGGPIPPGFKVEEKYSLGLLIAGPTLFGLAYLLSAYSAFDNPIDPSDNRPWAALFIPVTGPWAFISENKGGDNFIYAFEGLAQLAGVGMFLGGILSPKEKLVKQSSVAFKPALHLGPSFVQLEMKF